MFELIIHLIWIIGLILSCISCVSLLIVMFKIRAKRRSNEPEEVFGEKHHVICKWCGKELK